MTEYSNLNPNRFFDRGIIRSMVAEEINKLIIEGLVKTYSLESVAKFLESLGYVDDVDYSCDYRNGNNFIIKYVVDNNTYTKYNNIVDKLQNVYGWFHGSTEIVVSKLQHNNKLLANKRDFFKKENIGNTYILIFEPKYDVISNNKQKYYHLTPRYNLKNILNIGLKPRQRNDEFSYGDEHRVYLLNRVDDVEINDLIRKLFFFNVKKPRSEKDIRTVEDFREYYLLEIDLSNQDDIDIYNDVNHSSGFYTTQNISPKLIKSISRYYIPEKGNIIKTLL